MDHEGGPDAREDGDARSHCLVRWTARRAMCAALDRALLARWIISRRVKNKGICQSQSVSESHRSELVQRFGRSAERMWKSWQIVGGSGNSWPGVSCCREGGNGGAPSGKEYSFTRR